MNANSLIEFPALQLAGEAKRSAPAKRFKGGKKTFNAPERRTELPAEHQVFNLNDSDSGDEDEIVVAASTDPAPSGDVMDVESLFEFDTSTLVQLANKACGKHTDPFWEGSRHFLGGESASSEVPDADYEVVQKLMKACLQKDRQIEVLKQTVCELLVWKATHARQQPQQHPQQQPQQQRCFAEPESIKQANVAEPTMSFRQVQMRADAPEFVSLGIPSLAKRPEAAQASVSSQPSKAPRRRLGMIQGGRLLSVPVVGQREVKDWRAERRTHSQWSSSPIGPLKDSRVDKKTEIRGVQKKLKGS